MRKLLCCKFFIVRQAACSPFNSHYFLPICHKKMSVRQGRKNGNQKKSCHHKRSDRMNGAWI